MTKANYTCLTYNTVQLRDWRNALESDVKAIPPKNRGLTAERQAAAQEMPWLRRQWKIV